MRITTYVVDTQFLVLLGSEAPMGESREGHVHGHGTRADADRRWLWTALWLILTFMAAEVVVGLIAGSLALISDAAHMLTDAAALGLALVVARLAARPARGRFTFGFTRAEALSAQANGATLLGLAVWFVVEGIRRLVHPPPVAGILVLAVALVGIGVNVAATWSLSRANRTNLNVAGAFQHILTDAFAFVATAVAGALVWGLGFTRADALAALVVAALMIRGGCRLLRDSGHVVLEAAPAGTDPNAIGTELAETSSVREVHDLHVWQITAGQPALSAHVLVSPGADCHAVRDGLERLLRDRHGMEHTTLQVDHTPGETAEEHCVEPHGAVYHHDGGFEPH
jgi:cobalt-zinc-cadmium efflux system protein